MTRPFRICALEELADPGSREFRLPDSAADKTAPGSVNSGFVVRHGEAIHAYLNRCPHLGLGLNWSPDQFLDAGGEFIQCATHGALFRPQDGYCVRGPCAGQALQALPVLIKEGVIWLQFPD